MLIRQALTGLKALLVFTLLLGLAYPLTMVLIAQVVPTQDSTIRNADGKVVGSALMAQPVTGDDWFYPRPSAGDYDGLASGASNLAATNPELVAAITARRTEIAEREDVDPARIPADAVTASASGLDPEISPEYARLQIDRVARETGLSREEVTTMVERNTKQPILGFIGEPRVNVVTLNNDLQNTPGTAVDVADPEN
ncbi:MULTISPECIES: potassium-transporting ATPase subunit KdpC [Brevibacterium]|uniref:Potassium-transporting ATPase KdpC subunit n=2 Tax=Brevibacterium casei TaxID=33889 RepID=K9AJM6_9MICO|nr:potassium-transporting ATPase subunit KdpC [Brevibacterium casei]NJE67756.1 potassium-transporting ATPase subunit KdpC [Brevibacterium sp. LS14]SII62715.1 potassium-transporting ATPase subunit C [Mycobacteroides abscessus subsp. abscessus]EKU47538.1 potassium-transporting ATPase subunit C [Brevibacterium casei S18]KZE17200.1 potassium transporter KtrA [Brevibacterium casei]MBE4696024.1 potassium-transporting ATPase subunit KdpC [Brevibacterium casei]